jgi:hypothetical protein
MPTLVAARHDVMDKKAKLMPRPMLFRQKRMRSVHQAWIAEDPTDQTAITATRAAESKLYSQDAKEEAQSLCAAELSAKAAATSNCDPSRK